MAASRAIFTTTSEPTSINATQENTTLDRILECAVVLNWKDLTRAVEETSIQVEYRTAASHALNYVKFWSSTERGHWRLICEYWMQSSGARQCGVTFHDGVFSSDLAWMLDAIMQHQAAFPPLPSDFPDGLIQLSRPGQSFIGPAQKDMTRALDRIARS